MRERVIIDGNNLWHAMRVHAPVPPVGRETMVRIVDRWAAQIQVHVMIVFDGPTPRDGLARQMATRRVDVRFSAPQTADDVIERLLKNVRDPAGVRVVTSDTAVRSDATHRRCRHTDSVRFIAELFPAEAKKGSLRPTQGPYRPPHPSSEKPDEVTADEAEEWVRLLGGDDLELPDEWNELR
jgi:predicted RNA-binding protein with PIN domain